MWKNWNPFRRKHKDSEIPTEQVNGKENTEVNLQYHENQHAAGGVKSHNHHNHTFDGESNTLQTNNEHTQACSSRTGENERPRADLNRTLPSRPTIKDHFDHVSNNNSGNRSFTAVHGPLLSTPIVPKVRRAVETNTRLRSPLTGRTSLLSRGKSVGRSSSLNYGSNNPAKTRAGQVPWVRLKRRESLGLADYISSRAPQSPNTVKIAPPVNSGLPAAPSFRSSPLIMTNDANRSRMLDTQTVVSALREKRKRFGETQASESMSEDMASWQASPKRRRQDSSQSNASSVSIPPMPETLPNLMPTPGPSSMLHIEHLSNQRPSTIPAVDVFSNHLKPGLGGVEQRLHEPVLVHSHSEGHNRRASDLNNSRLAQKALQSSLSSSMRARNNLSLLERGGVDLKRIRNHSSSLQRRASNASTLERSLGEPQAKSSCLQSKAPASPPATTANLETEYPSSSSSCTFSTSTESPALTLGTVSAPTKRKIAEGVLMRKQSLSMNSPLRSLKTIPSDGLMSTSDFEKDKQKEYQKRVLDLLQPEDKDAVSSAPVGVPATQTSIATTGLGLSSSLSLATAVSSTATTPAVAGLSAASSSASTSIAISASLDSLNKLVQSTSPTVPVVTTTPKSDIPSTGFSLSSAASITPLATSLLTSKVTTVPSSSTPTTGFSFGLPSQGKLPESTAAPSLSTLPGFQVNFGNVASPVSTLANSNNTTTTNSISSLSSVSSLTSATSLSSSTVLSPSNMFNIGTPASSAAPAPTQAGGFNFSSNLVSGSTATSVPLASSIGAKPQTGASSTPSFAQFGALSQLGTSNAPVSSALSGLATGMPAITTATTSTPQQGGFTFGATAGAPTAMPVAGAGGFQFGLSASSQQNSTITTLSTPALSSAPQAGGFAFGASQTSISAGGLGTGGGFNLSSQTAASSAAPAFGVTSATPAPNHASTSLSNPVSAMGGFNFGAPTGAPAASAAPTGGFAFGAAQPMPNVSVNQTLAHPQLSTSQIPNPGLSMFTLSATKPSAPGFNFSQNPTSTSTTQPSAFTFGATGTTSSQPGTFNIAPNTTAPSAKQNLFGAPASTSSNASSTFGAMGSGGTGSDGVFNFGGSTNTAAPSPFGAAGAGATANPSPFGSSTASTATPGIFSFGSTTNASTTSANPPVFGSSATNSSSIVQSPFGAGATSAPFGATASTKPPAFGSTSSVFSSAASAQPVFGATAPSTNAFGTNVTSPGFGSSSSGLATAAAPPPAFGSNSATPANQPFTFGAQPSSSTTNQPAPPAFGSTMGSSVFGASTNPATASTVGAPSVFGTNTASAGGGVFGGGLGQAAKPNQPSVFGSSATPSVFGSSQPTPAPAFGSTQSSTNVFGASANTASTAPAFGATPAQQPQSGASVFGSGAQNSTSTPFGSAGGFGTPKPASANPFGAPASTAQGGFNFSATPAGQNAASPFGASTSSTASSGFNFGQAAPPAANPSGGFNFSAAPSTPAFQPTTPNNGGFNFAAGAGSTPSFNFNAATPGTPNMFTPQTPGATHRPRVAARRGARRGRR